MACIQCHDNVTIISSASAINVYTDKSHFSLKILSSVHVKNRNDPINKPNDSNNRILCMTLSKNGRYFAASDDNKNLAVWDTTQSPWSLIFCRTIVRKAVCISFTNLNRLLLADKAGDVYEIDAINGKEDIKLVPIMGHVSMLLDMVLSEDEKFLITCDRDEKIRISQFPNSYNIECYCLGHTEYVIRAFILPNNPKILVSGSGDGTVRFWSIKDGTEVGNILCKNYITGIDSSYSIENCIGKEQASNNQKDMHETTEKFKTAIKSMKYSIKNKILAVLYSTCFQISLFSVECQKKLEYHHIQNINFTEKIWDADFDRKGFLWILVANPDEVIQIHQPYITDKIEFRPLTFLPPDLQDTVYLIKQNWEFFKDSLNLKNEHDMLFKQWYDNVKDYYERKEERLSQTSKKMKT